MKRFYVWLFTMFLALSMFPMEAFAEKTNASETPDNKVTVERMQSESTVSAATIKETPSWEFEYGVVQFQYIIINKYIGSSTEVRIPATIDGLPVKRLGDEAFYDLDNLTKVILPEGLLRIGDSAFCDCNRLSEINFPNSLTSIGDSAFFYCNNLTEITLPNSLTSIGESAFSCCRSLTEITLPNSLTSIGVCAFSGCRSLTEVTLPNSLTSIDYMAFSGCSSLTEITLPNSPTSIGESAFSGCRSLTEITLPNSLTSIGKYAFSGCSSLTEVTLPNSLTSIGACAFSDCSSLTKVILPSSLTYIDECTFEDCYRLSEVIFSEGLTSISNEAFKGCYGLSNINLPKGLERIGQNAFEYCYGVIYVTLPEGLRTIANNAFKDCYSLSSINLPSSLTYIGTNAFKNCDYISFTVWPNSFGEEYVVQNNYTYNYTYNNNPFQDVDGNAFYFNSVMWAVTNKITNGMTSTLFGTGVTCTREQIVTFLWNYAGKPAPKDSSCTFNDAKSSDYYYKAVLWASENGYVSGYSEDTFGVGDACTREQIVMILWRYMNTPEPVSTICTFTDCDENGYYYKAMLWAVENKIVSGYTEQTFGVGDSCTREQIVTFLYRLDNNLQA